MTTRAQPDGDTTGLREKLATILRFIFSRKRSESGPVDDKPPFELTPGFLHARAGRPRVEDEFAALLLPPWKKTRLRRKRDGRCVDCGGARPCHKHAQKRTQEIGDRRGRGLLS